MKTLIALLASTTLLFSQAAFDPLSKSNISMQVAVTKSSSDGPRELKITFSDVGNVPQPTVIEVFQLVKNWKGEKEIKKEAINSETGIGEVSFSFPEIRKSSKFVDWSVRAIRDGKIVAEKGTLSPEKLASK